MAKHILHSKLGHKSSLNALIVQRHFNKREKGYTTNEFPLYKDFIWVRDLGKSNTLRTTTDVTGE